MWRDTGPYVPTSSSKAGLLDETRLFVLSCAETGEGEETARKLRDGALLERARQTRRTIVDFIRRRVTKWQPPAWVLDDLVGFAREPGLPALPS